jgi:hypothetical protein
MNRYLVGFNYHEPEAYDLYRKGVAEDFESSTGIFITAESSEKAISWGEQIAVALLKVVNSDESLNWKEMGYHAWIEKDEAKSSWRHCFSFFQTVKTGEMPNFRKMGTNAYLEWAKANGIKYVK